MLEGPKYEGTVLDNWEPTEEAKMQLEGLQER